MFQKDYIPSNKPDKRQKCHITHNYTVIIIIIIIIKQKYCITLFREENKSIILHHVLANSPENAFVLAYVIQSEIATAMNKLSD